jgi:hypothetical protein
MSASAAPPPIRPYNKKELREQYGIGPDTLNAWLKEVPALGKYAGRLFTAEQVRKIYEHCGPPS